MRPKRSEERDVVELPRHIDHVDEVLAASLSYPAVVYSILLAAAVIYWLVALVGLVGVDTLDFGGDAPDIDVDLDADAEVGHAAAAAGMWSRSSLRRVPFSIAATLVFFFGWLICHLTTHFAGALLSAVLPASAWGTGLLLLATVLALFLSNKVAVPLAPVFDTHEAKNREDLVGKVVEVRTGHVDGEFGQATAEDGGAGLIVQVRCEPGRLKRGQRALVISHDVERETYDVEPLDEILLDDSGDTRSRNHS